MTSADSSQTGLSWVNIFRLGLVQSALGSIVALSTSTFNRLMVVELVLPAMIAAGLVAWHYAIQLSRPRWGHGSDVGRRRTPWILGGMAVLGLGAMLAAFSTLLMGQSLARGLVLGVVAYAMIGVGVGACGTSLLALMASEAAPKRRPAAAALTWILMILGIVLTATIAGKLLDPYSPERLLAVAAGVAGVAFLVAVGAVWGIEGSGAGDRAARPSAEKRSFGQSLGLVWADRQARRFTLFVFVSMLAYSAQDLILEPYAGLLFHFTVGQSTQLSGVQHAGVLLGMLTVGGLGALAGGHSAHGLRWWTVGGCIGSAAALLALALAGQVGPAWPLKATVFGLGYANGVFAVAAIGSMMALAGGGGGDTAGIRMGVWGAAQATAFGLGGFAGAASLDVLRGLLANDAAAFLAVFSLEACLFLGAAVMALRLADAPTARDRRVPSLPTDLTPDMAGHLPEGSKP
jgi:MFS transporter, BCD family, chlorophyll transporter